MTKQTMILILFLFTILCADAQGIQFEEGLSWAAIKAKAKTENRYIFIDAFTTWCGPCKAMAAETFPQAAVGEVINATFIPVKIQMDKTGNDNQFVQSLYDDAARIAKESNIAAYPTLLFYSPEGKLVHKTVGYKDANGLIEEAKNALNPDKQYFTQLEKHRQGKLDTGQIKALAMQAKQMGDNERASDVAQAYIKILSKKEIYTKGNLVFISSFLSGSKDKNFNIFLRNAEKVNAIVGKNFAENTVMSIAAKEEIVPHEQEKNPDWKGIEKRMIAKYGALGEERVWGDEILYYLSVKDWDNFGKYYKKYFDRVVLNERSFIHINNVSWSLFEHVSDKEVLATAVKAMQYDIEKFDRNDPASLDTYANLLYKSGNREEAIKWEEKAVQLSNNNKEIIDTLEKMKRGEKTWKNQ